MAIVIAERLNVKMNVTNNINNTKEPHVLWLKNLPQFPNAFRCQIYFVLIEFVWFSEPIWYVSD